MENIDLKNEFYYEGGREGCLLIHGFTGTPAELRELGGRLRDKGYTVLGVRLKGHGTTVEDMKKCTYKDWIASTAEGYNRLRDKCDKIYVIGHSMGSMLALYMAENYDIDKVIALSPPVKLTNRASKYAFILKYFIKDREWGVTKRSIDEAKYLLGYPKFSVKSLDEFNKLSSLARRNLKSIDKPLLVIHSHGDKTVDEAGIDILYNNVSSNIKEKLFLERSGHNITIECEKENVFKAVLDFIK